MMATVFLLLGAFIVGINLHTSFFRRWLHERLHPGEPYLFVSGFPLVGSVFLGIAWLFYPAGSHLGYTALVLMLLDTGGPHWLIRAVWLNYRQRDRGGV